MKRIKAIVLMTVREHLRQPVILVFLVFASGITILAWFITPFSLGESPKIVRDIGLAAANITGIVLAILFGSQLFYRDIKKKAMYCTMTRPVSMTRIILGKFLGVAILILFIECMLHLILQLTILFTEGSFSPRLLIVLPFSLLEIYIVLGWVFLFTSFSSPGMGTIMAIIFYLMGHASLDIKSFAIQSGTGVLGILTHVLYFIIPNLEYLNLRLQIVFGLPVHADHLVFGIVYGITYMVLLISLSTVLFSKRDFT